MPSLLEPNGKPLCPLVSVLITSVFIPWLSPLTFLFLIHFIVGWKTFSSVPLKKDTWLKACTLENVFGLLWPSYIEDSLARYKNLGSQSFLSSQPIDTAPLSSGQLLVDFKSESIFSSSWYFICFAKMYVGVLVFYPWFFPKIQLILSFLHRLAFSWGILSLVSAAVFSQLYAISPLSLFYPYHFLFHSFHVFILFL